MFIYYFWSDYTCINNFLILYPCNTETFLPVPLEETNWLPQRITVYAEQVRVLKINSREFDIGQSRKNVVAYKTSYIHTYTNCIYLCLHSANFFFLKQIIRSSIRIRIAPLINEIFRFSACYIPKCYYWAFLFIEDSTFARRNIKLDSHVTRVHFVKIKRLTREIVE